MKLLTPTEQQDATNAQEARGILRLQALVVAEKELRIKLANAEADFNETLAKNRNKWEEEEKAHELRRIEMEREIKSFETKKVPVFESDTKQAEANLALARAKEQELYNQELTEKLEEKLDELGEREQTIQQREKKVSASEKGILAQKEAIQGQSEALTQALAQFTTEKASWEKDIEKKNEDLFMERHALEGRKFAIERSEITFIEKEKAIAEREQAVVEKEQELKKPIEDIEKQANELLLKAQQKEKELSERESHIGQRELEVKESVDSRMAHVLVEERKLQVKQADFDKETELLNEAKTLFSNERIALGEKREKFEIQKMQLDEAQKAFKLEKQASHDNLLVREAAVQKREDNVSATLSDILRRAEELKITVEGVKQAKELNAVISKDLSMKEKKLKKDIETAKNEADLLVHERQVFDTEREEFVKYKTNDENALITREAEVKDRERQIGATEQKVKRQEKFLAEWAARLKDTEGALQRAKREIG